jgi:hypothetical protein
MFAAPGLRQPHVRSSCAAALVAAATLGSTFGCVGTVGQPLAPGTEGMPTPGGPGGGEPSAPTGPGGPPAPGAPNTAACAGDLIGARVWRLSDEQYAHAVADLLPGVTVPPVSTPGRSKAEFVNVAELYPVSGALAVDLGTAARAVAAAAVADLPARLGCPAGQAEIACATTFIDRFASRAYRRPLEAEDRQPLLDLFALGAERSVADGVRLVIEAVLQMPSFLYRTELGAGAATGGPLAAYELASSLSFFLLDSIPDPPLWRAAEDGSLATAEGYRQQVERLLAEPRVRANLGRVLQKWAGLGEGITTELASEQFPEYDEPLRQSLLEESRLVFQDLLAGGGTIADLLTSRASFVDRRLASLYGVPYSGGTSAAFVRATLPADQRAGVMTQGGFLVSKSRGEPVVHRGKWVREEILCGAIPEPPPDAAADPTTGEPPSARQAAEARMTHATCGACHQLMDAIGLTFAQYDPLGRFTARDERGAIDASGAIRDSDVEGPVDDARALARRLAGSEQARLCIESKLYAYALGRDPAVDARAALDRCDVRALDRQVAARGGRLLDVVAAIALAPEFRVRAPGGAL